MKYRLTFKPIAPVVLPMQYYRILQASVLTWLGRDEYGKFLHDVGYEHNKRVFKNYTFSHIFGNSIYNKNQNKLTFTGTIYFYLSFYTDDCHEIILQNWKEKKPLHLGKILLELENIEVANEEYRDCIVDTASPVTIHSTFELPDGRKKPNYYEPWEKDFSKMICENLIRKFIAINGAEPREKNFDIRPVRGTKLAAHTIHYNRFIIKGWTGQFQISGSPELIQTALLAGIGARNGIGMGCILQRNDM